MLRRNDFILLAVLSVSVAAGVFLPDIGRVFQPYLTYFVMILLFMSFLSIRIEDIRGVLRNYRLKLALLTAVKLLALPTLVYYLFRLIYPDFALAALLLTGISTGVVAPFISTLVGGNSALVLALVVITSLLSPFSLPALVELLAGRTIEIPLGGMVKLLTQVIFIPMILGALLRRIAPNAAAGLLKRGFPISLCVFAAINLGVFSKYSTILKQQPSMVLAALAVAFVLAGIYLAAGLFCLGAAPIRDRAGAAVSMANMNNVLVIVLASQFFGAIEPTLAAMYMFPFFAVIVPLRVIIRKRGGEG